MPHLTSSRGDGFRTTSGGVAALALVSPAPLPGTLGRPTTALRMGSDAAKFGTPMGLPGLLGMGLVGTTGIPKLGSVAAYLPVDLSWLRMFDHGPYCTMNRVIAEPRKPNTPSSRGMTSIVSTLAGNEWPSYVFLR